MITIDIIEGDGRYFTDLAQINYFTESGEPPGFWLGTGAKQLGLANSIVSQEGLQNILNGYHPDSSKKLVQNAGKENRQKGFDLTFSAPKSFSVMKVVAPEWIRKEMDNCLRQAVANTINVIEEQALYTRRGAQGTGVERAKAVVAAFPHSTSRAGEPQDHIHALFSNVCVRDDLSCGTFFGHVYPKEEGKPRTGWNPLVEYKRTAGSMFQVELASLLIKNLGFGIEPGDDGFSFRITQIPREADKYCSTRSKEIEEEKQRIGIFHGKASYIAAVSTRSEKYEVNLPKLYDKFTAELEPFGVTPEKIEGMCNAASIPLNREELLLLAIEAAHNDLTQDQGSFSMARLYERTANNLVATGISLKELDHAIKNEITEGSLVSLGTHHLQRILTNQQTLDLEFQATKAIERASTNQTHTVGEPALKSAIDKTQSKEGFIYDDEYRRALKYLTIGKRNGPDRAGAVRVLTGDAGSGKTTLISTAKDAWEATGYRVVGAALAGTASKRLENATGIKSYTIDKWCHELEKGIGHAIKHAARMLGRKAMHKKSETWRAKDSRFQLDSKTVLVVDEASLTDSPKLYKLQLEAEKAGALVVYVGDQKQCQAVGLGGGFALAERMTNGVRISRNFRQRDELDKEMAKLASEGKSIDLLTNLIDRNRLHVEETKDEARKRLVDDWKVLGIRNPQQNKIFVATHDDRLALNQLCQEERIGIWKRASRLLGFQNHEGQTIYAGDIIQFKDNLVLQKQDDTYIGKVKTEFKKLLGKRETEEVRRGQFGTVVSINPFMKQFRVKVENGRVISIPFEVIDDAKRSAFGEVGRDTIFNKPKKRDVQISLGYATTTHAGQGNEFEHVYVMSHAGMQDQELTYTQLSRGKLSTQLYSTAVEVGDELTIRSILNDGGRGLGAIDELDEKLKDSRNTPGHRISDNPLAKAMARSNKKQFVFEKPLEYQTETNRDIDDELERKII